MSEPHLSVEDLRAFAARRLDAPRVQEIFAHLSSCVLCRDRSQQALSADRSVERLIDEVEERHHPRSWFYVLAACLAIAAVGVLLFLLRMRTTPPAQPSPSATIVQETSTAPVATTTQSAPSVHPTIVDALKRGALPPPQQLAVLLATPTMERVRGDDSTAIASYEPNREVVATQRPQFRFPTARGVPSVVRVFDRDAEVLQSEAVADGQWTATADLPRGVTYTWQVESKRNGEIVTAPAPPAPPARFIVASEDALRILEDARRAEPQNHLLLGILSARAGLRDEAENHLRIAVRESDDRRVRELLRSVETWPR